jgi:hypothetical protein
MKEGDIFFGLFLLICTAFLASAFLYSPAENKEDIKDVQAYCKEKMKNEPVIMCAGVWELNDNGGCSFKCTGADEMEAAKSVPALGGDRDERGCMGSAGYSWCESKGRCIRMWEEDCSCGGSEGYGCPVAYKCDAGKCAAEY